MRDKFQSPVLAFCVSVFLVLISFHAGRRTAKPCLTVTDTLTVIDTLCYYYPMAKDSVVVRYVTRLLPVVRRREDDSLPLSDSTSVVINADVGNQLAMLSGESDSIPVEIPITQVRYASSEYEAWVSGYEACLDSIRVYPKTTIVRESLHKPPNRWHIGISSGYGYGFRCRNPEPYIGIGITYSIISF